MPLDVKRGTANKEEKLIKACQESDRRAQAELFYQYAPRFLGIAYRFAGDYDVANDLLQEAFVRIFNHIGDFRFKGSFEGWMRRIVVTTSINYMKKQYRILPDDIDMCDLTDMSEIPEVLAKINCEAIIAEINKLPPGYRTILNLYAIEGYSYTEIAEALQLKEVTVRTQYMRAKQKLAKALEEQNITDYAKKIV